MLICIQSADLILHLYQLSVQCDYSLVTGADSDVKLAFHTLVIVTSVSCDVLLNLLTDFTDLCLITFDILYESVEPFDHILFVKALDSLTASKPAVQYPPQLFVKAIQHALDFRLLYRKLGQRLVYPLMVLDYYLICSGERV